MLIRQAQVNFGECRDVRIAGGLVVEIAQRLSPLPDEMVIDAAGCALLPGLHDHHIHLRALAAARASVVCGPPEIQTEVQLIDRLRSKSGEPDWLRGIGYHESIAGEIDRDWLDRHIPHRPVRIQHRSGRLWMFNTCALQQLAPTQDAPLEKIDGKLTGRLYDADDWLRQRLPVVRHSLQEISEWLASVGVTALTDTTHTNTQADYESFVAASVSGEITQRLCIMGDASLEKAATSGLVIPGPRKFHLHDADLPDFSSLVAEVSQAHSSNRNCAFHCVARGELVYALAALAEAGVRPGDRIEHAGVTPPELLADIRSLGVAVVTQPHFIRERGDDYRRDVAPEDQPWLYRLRSFLDAGVPLLGSSDAPFGNANPWHAMQSAFERYTDSGVILGKNECLTPEQALALFTCELRQGKVHTRRVAPGVSADLCLLQQPWEEIRTSLNQARVRLTLRAGQVIWMK